MINVASIRNPQSAIHNPQSAIRNPQFPSLVHQSSIINSPQFPFIIHQFLLMTFSMKTLAGFLILAALVGGFILAAAQRLGEVPVYETDESYTLQVSYEMLNRGKLALPMYRYLGGNIENVWHSLTPLYFAALSGFLKVFGFGVPQGRAFNLITFVAALLMVFLIGRRLFDIRAGLIAVTLIISDQTVFERARLLRNDYAAEALALTAFLLYEAAERRKSGKLFIAAGLAAGAGVMCHSSICYMIGAICLLMLVRRGLAVFKQRSLYQFLAGAFAVMAYELIYIAVDFKNFRLQYRDDNLHFSVFSPLGWWYNLLDEPRRYIRWCNAYDVTFPNVPRTLLHLFQFLAVAGFVYLAIRCATRLWSRRSISDPSQPCRIDDPRSRLFLVAICSAMFFAVIAHKAGYYNAHLVTWYSLCGSVLLCDAWDWSGRGLATRLCDVRLVRLMKTAVLILIGLAYGGLLVRQYVRYSREARNPDLASFADVQSVLRNIVPNGVCPVAVKAPVLWLAFPEKDECFATIERRMAEAVDIDGKEFALIVRPKSPDYWARDLDQSFHLVGSVEDTPYGNFQIYYTGTDPSYRALQPKNYYFFQRWRGYVSREQIADARTIWDAGPEGLTAMPGAGSLGFRSVDVQAGTAYQLSFDVARLDQDVELVVSAQKTGMWLKQSRIKASTEMQHMEMIFRTLDSDRVNLFINAVEKNPSGAIHFEKLVIREIARL